MPNEIPHVPYKFHSPKSFSTARDAIAKHTGDRDEPVTGEVLQSVLDDVFADQSEQHRQDWLEIERWGGRLETGGGGGVTDPIILEKNT